VFIAFQERLADLLPVKSILYYSYLMYLHFST